MKAFGKIALIAAATTVTLTGTAVAAVQKTEVGQKAWSWTKDQTTKAKDTVVEKSKVVINNAKKGAAEGRATVIAALMIKDPSLKGKVEEIIAANKK